MQNTKVCFFPLIPLIVPSTSLVEALFIWYLIGEILIDPILATSFIIPFKPKPWNCINVRWADTQILVSSLHLSLKQHSHMFSCAFCISLVYRTGIADFTCPKLSSGHFAPNLFFPMSSPCQLLTGTSFQFFCSKSHECFFIPHSHTLHVYLPSNPVTLPQIYSRLEHLVPFTLLPI